MASQAHYKSDYLKVTSTDDNPIGNIDNILRTHSAIVNEANRSEKIDPRVFGFFHEKFRTYEWIILQFDPCSADCGFEKENTAYKTRKQALNAAVRYFNKNGYQAKQFDLEGMIDKI